MLDLDNLPEEFVDDLLRQKNYIVLKLAMERVKHGHTHRNNFNVRFDVFIPGESIPQVRFDINVAVQVAKENSGATIKPMLVLRDWDKGVIVSNNTP